MSYIFDASERARLLEAIEKSSGAEFEFKSGYYKAVKLVGSDCAPFYQVLSDVIGERYSSGDLFEGNTKNV